MQLVSITSQGQVSIPVKMKREVLKDAKKALVTRTKDGILIKPVKDVFSLRGSVTPRTKPENFKKMRKDFINYLSTRGH